MHREKNRLSGWMMPFRCQRAILSTVILIDLVPLVCEASYAPVVPDAFGGSHRHCRNENAAVEPQAAAFSRARFMARFLSSTIVTPPQSRNAKAHP